MEDDVHLTQKEIPTYTIIHIETNNIEMKRDYEQAAHSITTLAFRLKKLQFFNIKHQS